MGLLWVHCHRSPGEKDEGSRRSSPHGNDGNFAEERSVYAGTLQIGCVPAAKTACLQPVLAV
jgi:hypothetical protein